MTVLNRFEEVWAHLRELRDEVREMQSMVNAHFASLEDIIKEQQGLLDSKDAVIRELRDFVAAKHAALERKSAKITELQELADKRADYASDVRADRDRWIDRAVEAGWPSWRKR